jgi:anti-sigma B factor antagonist
LVELARNGKYQVVVDLEGVEFLDSTGLRVLMEARQRLQKLRGAFRVVCARSMILKALCV